MVSTVKRSIKGELKRIQRIINMMRDVGKKHPGFIDWKRQGKHVYYYLCRQENGRRTRVYLGKAGSADLRKAISVIFRHTHRTILEHNKAVLENTLRDLWDDSIPAILAQMPKACREANRDISYLDPRMERLKAWAAADYKKNTKEFPETENYAMDGTRVRSKGEEIWYNLLLMAGIPFRYDCVLEVVNDNGVTEELSPDFLIQCYDGTLIAIEHLGRLDLEKYRHGLATKIRLYQLDGYVVGDNLFLTSDTAGGGTNSEMIVRKLAEIEELFYRCA